MITFYEFLQSIENNKLNIPHLPSNMVRLTHFTPFDPKKILNNGFKVNGKIDSTADSYLDNNDVIKAIKIGKMGNMERARFGNYVIIIDLPIEHYGVLRNPSNWGGGIIPKSQILGYVDRGDMSFHSNPYYNPNKMKKPKVRDIDKFMGMGSDEDQTASFDIKTNINDLDQLVF